jgi:hypothetical protein
MKNLKSLYNEGIKDGNPFVIESINRSMNVLSNSKNGKKLFVPSISFMGAQKNNSTILEFVKILKTRSQNAHFTNEYEFLGDTSQIASSYIIKDEMNIIDGQLIGIKNKKNKPILLEDLMEEEFLDLDPKCYGIYIPNDEILKRPKYEWFAVMETNELLTSNLSIVKYMKSSIIDTIDEYSKSNETKSVTSI